MFKHRMSVVLLIAVLSAVAGGCGKDDDDSEAAKPAAPAKGTFVGKVEGTNAYIALVSDGKRVAGYVCDGDKDKRKVTVSAWLAAARIKSTRAELVSRKGERFGFVAFQGDRARGTVALDPHARREYAFRAELAKRRAGLYRGAKGKVGQPPFAEAGNIVLADETFRGAINLNGRVNNFINISYPDAVDSPIGSVSLGKATPGFIDIDVPD
jgi:hypothetical protein